jgi:antitoxin Phd
MKSVHRVPIKAFPCPGILMQRQVEERKHGVIDFLDIDLHGFPKLFHQRLFEVTRGFRSVMRNPLRRLCAWGQRLPMPLDRVYMTTVVTLKEIQLRDAKAALSAVVDDAVRGAPCVITRHGRREAVLISYEEWEKLSRVPSFGRLLMSAPLEKGDLPKRNRKRARRVRR